MTPSKSKNGAKPSRSKAEILRVEAREGFVEPPDPQPQHEGAQGDRDDRQIEAVDDSQPVRGDPQVRRPLLEDARSRGVGGGDLQRVRRVSRRPAGCGQAFAGDAQVVPAGGADPVCGRARTGVGPSAGVGDGVTQPSAVTGCNTPRTPASSHRTFAGPSGPSSSGPGWPGSCRCCRTSRSRSACCRAGPAAARRTCRAAAS